LCFERAAIEQLALERGKEALTLVGLGGWPGWTALHAPGSAKSAQELKPFLPLSREMLECSDGSLSIALPWSTMRQAAASAMASACWLSKDWQELKALVAHGDEQVRLGAIGTLDDLAELAEDIQPILQTLLAVFDQPDAGFAKTREAAAGVSLWFLLKRNEKKVPETLYIAGVDILKIAEVRKKVEEFRENV
jgi:hypothetical protein